MIRNIVFDMGRVLMEFDNMVPALRCAKDAEKAKIIVDAIFNHPSWGPLVDGGEMDESDYMLAARDRLPTEDLRQIVTEMAQNWWLDVVWPKPGMQALLGELLEKGFRLYVLSNCGFVFRKFQHRIPQIDHFSGILISAEEKLIKPDPAIYRRLCEKFDLQAEECLFIDDLQKNIEGALSIGMRGYCFADGDVSRLRDYLNTL